MTVLSILGKPLAILAHIIANVYLRYIPLYWVAKFCVRASALNLEYLISHACGKLVHGAYSSSEWTHSPEGDAELYTIIVVHQHNNRVLYYYHYIELIIINRGRWLWYKLKYWYSTIIGCMYIVCIYWFRINIKIGYWITTRAKLYSDIASSPGSGNRA